MATGSRDCDRAWDIDFFALDTMIAATAEAYDCVVVTDNQRGFADVEFINPLPPGAQ